MINEKSVRQIERKQERGEGARVAFFFVFRHITSTCGTSADQFLIEDAGTVKNWSKTSPVPVLGQFYKLFCGLVQIS